MISSVILLKESKACCLFIFYSESILNNEFGLFLFFSLCQICEQRIWFDLFIEFAESAA